MIGLVFEKTISGITLYQVSLHPIVSIMATRRQTNFQESYLRENLRQNSKIILLKN